MYFDVCGLASGPASREFPHQRELFRKSIKYAYCAAQASKQYADDSCLEFDSDVEALEKAFPKQVTVDRELTTKWLRKLPRNNHFDIVHLVLSVHPVNGELIFSEVDKEQNPATNRIDRMPAAAFAALVQDAKTSLVFLATCQASAIAVDVSPVTNIIATNIAITGQQAVEWEGCFYDLLATGESLFRAYEITKWQYTTAIRLIERQDVRFKKRR